MKIRARRAEPARAPKISTEPAQIQQLRAQLHSDDLMISAKTKEQEQIRKQIDLYQSRVQSSPAVEQQYKELTRGYQTALDSYNDLQKKLGDSQQAVNLERKQEGEQFVVLDPANLPDKPTFPNRPMFALGGFGWRLRSRPRDCVFPGDEGFLIQDRTGCGICVASAGARNGAGDRADVGEKAANRLRIETPRIPA